MSHLLNFLLIPFILFVLFYFYATRKFNYWKKRKVPFLPPIPFFGNAFELFTFRHNIGDFTRKIYDSTDEPVVGFFVCDEPYLMIRDPEIVKSVLVKDFHIFNNRSVVENKDADPMGSHILFILKTPDWRDMRRKMTPVFTSGKMKIMYQLISDSGKDMVEFLTNEIKINPIVDIREVSAKYTTDAISSTSFGINANCFKYENSEFRAVSRRIFNWAIWERVIATSCYFVAPKLVSLFRMKFVDKASTDFLRKVFWKTMNERQKTKFVRNDLLDILIELIKEQNIDDPLKLEGDKLVAQAIQFFIAGYETTSSTISFTLLELAANKDIQTRLRAEIKEVIGKTGGFTYDALKQMGYLDKCVKETLRKYPSLPFLDRRCNDDYQIPGTDIVLEKGSPIFIANWGFHFDPKYFPDPEKYDPERFTEENIQARPPFTYLPFGEGPRNCIGARFGTVSSKSAIAYLISEFEVELPDVSQYPIKLEKKGFLLSPIEGVKLKFRKI